jgi:phosphoglycerate dehydrogenase-like enzyme
MNVNQDCGEKMGLIWLCFDTQEFSDEQLAEVHSTAPELEVVVTKEAREIERRLDEVEIVVGHLSPEQTRLALAGKNLRWIQQWGAGADWLMRHPEAVRQDFVLTNASGVHAIPISEHILAVLLAFARRLPQAVRAQAGRQWRGPEDGQVFELAGKILLLLGTGAIGARTARLAAALDMQVIGIRRNAEESLEGVEAMFPPERLLELLPRADFVVLTLPLTPETRGLIGRQELQAMKPSAVIINIGRGGTIQEPGLIEALQEGRLAGAGLDVFESEPLPADSPLWDMPNVLITAHYAGNTPRYHERALAIFLDNLRRYVAGKPLKNVVNKELGY